MIKTMNAQEKELFLYVAEDATYETGDQAIFKASDFSHHKQNFSGGSYL